ncbi:MAG: ATP-binding protein [Pseudoruegeria sp.]
MKKNTFYKPYENQVGFVETPTVRRVMHLLEDGIRRVFITGSVGSGKTTLLRSLERHWKKTKRISIFIRLREVRTEADIIENFSRELRNNSQFHFNNAIVQSSSQSAYAAIFEQIDEQNADILLLLDGFDELREQKTIDRFLRYAAGIGSISIVASGRSKSLGSRQRSFFDEEILMEEFSLDELSGFIERRAPEVDVNSMLLQKLKRFGGGSPLVARMLVDLLSESEITQFLDEITEDPNQTLALLLDRLMPRIEAHADPDEARGFLTVLAFLGSLAQTEINERQYALARHLVKLGLVVENKGFFEFTHVLFREYFHSAKHLVPENFALDTIDLGAEEAELDGRLEAEFRPLPGCQALIKGSKNIVIGDRGAGKSAYFSQLPKLQGTSTSVSQIQHPANLLDELRTNGSELSSSDEFRAGWITIVAVTLAKKISVSAPMKVQRAASEITKLFNTAEPDKSLVGRLVDRIRGTSVKVKIGPVTIEPSLSHANRGKTVDLFWFIEAALRALSNENDRFIIAIDRVDEVHKYDRNLQEKAVQGLFLAETSLSTIEQLSIVIFLRSDLYEIYDIQEKNKLVSRSLKLTWRRRDLLDFLFSRLITSSSFPQLRSLLEEYPNLRNDIASAIVFPRRIEGEAPEDWLWSSLANGNDDVNPRQIILLLFLAQKYQIEAGFSGSTVPVFGESALFAAAMELSDLSYKEIRDDFRVSRTFLANCRAGRLSQFTLDEVKELFDETEGPKGNQIHQLERLGFLERVLLQSSDESLHQMFRVPKLYTRSWSAASRQ